MRRPALRYGHVLAALLLVGLGCWWALIETLLWLAGVITGGTR